MPLNPVPIVSTLRFEPNATPEIVELSNLELAIDPASIVLLTVPVSPEVTTVPVVAGNVITVPVPAIAAGITCIVPEVAPE